MLVYITKHALSLGIIEVDAQPVKGTDQVKVLGGKLVDTSVYHGKDWELTADAAIQKAERMRKREVLGHERRLETLRAMTFPIKKRRLTNGGETA